MQWRCLQAAIRCRCGPQASLRNLRDPTKVQHYGSPAVNARAFHCNPRREQDVVALRKELKDEKKASRTARRAEDAVENVDKDATGDWRLTVGIEIHAQLNTARKLFSGARMLRMLSLMLMILSCLDRSYRRAQHASSRLRSCSSRKPAYLPVCHIDPGSTSCCRSRLQYSTCQPLRPQALLLSRSAVRVPDHAVLSSFREGRNGFA